MSHYYQLCDDGAILPRHFTQMASRDELRATRITDVRKWWRQGQKVYPSVTTVGNVLAKHALVNWKIEQHLEAAWKIGPALFTKYHSVDEFIAAVKALAEIKMDIAPSAGTAMHKVLEDWIQGKDTPPEYDHITDAVGIELGRIEVDHEWKPEVYFTHPFGFAGCSDLVNRDGIVGDWKSKQTADKFKRGKMAYDEQRMQLAAYRVGLRMPKARCFNGFVCIETGEVDIHWHTEDELDHGWRLFQHALAIWQLQNGWPDELREAA